MDDGVQTGVTQMSPPVEIARRHRANAPADAIGRLEWVTQRLARSLQRAVELVASDNNVSVPEYHLLLAISDDKGRSNAEIARLMFVTPQSANRVLSDLEQRGLVVRADDPTHGRVRKATLTPEGRMVLQACTDRITAIESRVLSGLDDEQGRVLLPALRQAADTIAGGYFGESDEEFRALRNRRIRQPTE
ncbi:MAG: MarR family transcriptional regulator [Pseudolysinimonas sp.]